MSQDEIIHKLSRLGERERQVFDGFCLDLPYWQIGERLHISESTVGVHMYHIMAKLDLPEKANTPFKKKKLLFEHYCTHLVPSQLAVAPPDEEEPEIISDDQLQAAKELDKSLVVWKSEVEEDKPVEPLPVDPFPPAPPPPWRDWVRPAVAVVVGGLVVAALFRFGVLGGERPTDEPASNLEATIEVAIALTQIAQGQQPAAPVPQAEAQEPAQAPPVSAPVTNSTPAFPEIILSEGGIPSGGSLEIQVPTGEIHVVTSGPANVAGVFLPGGVTRGSVIVLLPGNQPYTLTNLVPTQNWHGAYRASTDQWPVIAEDRATAMHAPGNCTGGAGCDTVDILVVAGNQIIAQYEDTATTTASQSGGPKFEERFETGLGRNEVYTITLAEDEALSGDATDVENRGGPCLVFWGKGPRTITFSVYEGGWNRYSGVVTEQDLQEVIDIPYNYLTNQHDFCKTVEVQIVELGR